MFFGTLLRPKVHGSSLDRLTNSLIHRNNNNRTATTIMTATTSFSFLKLGLGPNMNFLIYGNINFLDGKEYVQGLGVPSETKLRCSLRSQPIYLRRLEILIAAVKFVEADWPQK